MRWMDGCNNRVTLRLLLSERKRERFLTNKNDPIWHYGQLGKRKKAGNEGQKCNLDVSLPECV